MDSLHPAFIHLSCLEANMHFHLSNGNSSFFFRAIIWGQTTNHSSLSTQTGDFSCIGVAWTSEGSHFRRERRERGQIRDLLTDVINKSIFQSFIDKRRRKEDLNFLYCLGRKKVKYQNLGWRIINGRNKDSGPSYSLLRYQQRISYQR